MNSEPDLHPLGSFRSIAVGSFWTAMGYGLRYVLAAAASVVVARLLGVEAFGEYGMITSTVALLGTAADLGMSVSAARFVGAFRVSDPERAGRSLSMSVQATLVMSAIVAVLLLFSAQYVVTVWLRNPALRLPLQLAAFTIVFTAVGSAVSGGLRGLGLFKQMAVMEMSIAGLATLMMVMGAWAGQLEGAVAGFVVGSAVRMMVNVVLLQRHVYARGWRLLSAAAWQEAGAIVRFSVPAFAGGFLAPPVLWAIRVLLANSPNGYRELGTFSAALQWQTPLTFFSVVLGMVLLPSMSEQFQQGNRRRLEHTFQASFTVLAGVQLVSAGMLVLLSRYVANLYGHGFEGLSVVLPLVVVATFFNAVLSVPGQVLAAMNRMWLGFALNATWAVTFLLASVLVAPRFGAAGVSAAYLLAYLVHALTSTASVIVLLGMPLGGTMVPMLAGSTVALGTLAWWAVGSGEVAFLIAGIFATVYALNSGWRSLRRTLGDGLRAVTRVLLYRAGRIGPKA